MNFNFDRESNVRLSVAALIVLLSMLWVSLTAVAAEDGGIVVTAVEWKTKTSELLIKGTGAGRKQTVTIQDANSEVDIGTTVSRRDGRWNFRKRNLSDPPCMVLIVLNDDQGITSGYTKNAPRECVDPTPPEKSLTQLTIDGPAQIDESSTAQYTCTAEFSDGSSAAVNGNALWAVAPSGTSDMTSELAPKAA